MTIICQGDIVCRTLDGSDEHEVVEIDYSWGMLKVRCIKEPVHLDGSEPWIKKGEIEDNLIRRYALIRRKDKP